VGELLKLRKTVLEYRAKLIGVASLLLCVAFASQALTLGRIRGAALIGQPLNMVVPVQMDAGEDASAACFDADVFHADTRQDPSRVKLVVEPSGQAGTVNVRILSSVVVDEPMVTLYLRTICGQKTTRRYVLLADLPSEVDSAIAATRAPGAVVSAPVASAAALATGVVGATSSSTVTEVAAPAAVAQPKAPAKPKPKVVKKVVKPPVNKTPEPKPSADAAATKAAPQAPAGQPRLTLDSPVLLSEQVAALASTPPPDPLAEAQRDLLKIQTLESDVKALLALAAKNEASLLDLRTRLQVAESERLPNWMVYALGALVLACLAAIAVLLRRQRQALPHGNGDWSASVAAATPPDMPESNTSPAVGRVSMPGLPDSKLPASPETPAPVANAPRQADVSVTQVDVSLLEMSESSFDKLMQSGVVHSAIRKPQPTAAPVAATGAEPRTLNSGSVFDVRQQAEFFVSLGQTDQAVRILEKQISDSHEPNPHVYLDLLAIFHSLSLKVDFRQFREDFNLLFNGQVPEFASFKDEGKDLEAYPSVLTAIDAVWPSAKALSVIESFIFRDPWKTGSQAFDLAAFRDLLLLHAVVQRMLVASPAIAPSGQAPGSAAAAQAQPYFADSGLGMPLPMPSPYVPEVPSVPGQQAMDLDLDLAFDRLDLDLNFSDEPAPSAAQSPQQDVDLDLSLPLLTPLDLELPAASEPPVDNLIDFDMSVPDPRPAPDEKSAG
jgi:hypothetical protein